MKSSARHSLLRWVLCAAASAAVLNGASITYSVSTPNYPMPGQTGYWSADLAIPQFNDSNAILTAISFDLTAFIGVTASGTNTTGSDAIYTFRSFGAVVVYPPERLARDLFVYLPISGSFAVPPGPFSYTGPTPYRLPTGTVARTLLPPVPGGRNGGLPRHWRRVWSGWLGAG